MAAQDGAAAKAAREAEAKRAWREFYEESKPAEPLSALDRTPPAQKVVGPSGREYHSTSIFCLYAYSEPRKTAILMVESRWFDPLILMTILTNCTTMAFQSPLDPPGTVKAAWIDTMEWGYLYIFTFELLTKILAYGFAMHKHSYLRDPWCQLDFVVVTLAWIPILFPSFGDYSVIRSVRALRPLRALKRVPGMPQMITAILAALPQCVRDPKTWPWAVNPAVKSWLCSQALSPSLLRARTTLARTPEAPWPAGLPSRTYTIPLHNTRTAG